MSALERMLDSNTAVSPADLPPAQEGDTAPATPPPTPEPSVPEPTPEPQPTAEPEPTPEPAPEPTPAPTITVVLPDHLQQAGPAARPPVTPPPPAPTGAAAQAPPPPTEQTPPTGPDPLEQVLDFLVGSPSEFPEQQQEQITQDREAAKAAVTQVIQSGIAAGVRGYMEQLIAQAQQEAAALDTANAVNATATANVEALDKTLLANIPELDIWQGTQDYEQFVRPLARMVLTAYGVPMTHEGLAGMTPEVFQAAAGMLVQQVKARYGAMLADHKARGIRGIPLEIPAGVTPARVSPDASMPAQRSRGFGVPPAVPHGPTTPADNTARESAELLNELRSVLGDREVIPG